MQLLFSCTNFLYSRNDTLASFYKDPEQTATTTYIPGGSKNTLLDKLQFLDKHPVYVQMGQSAYRLQVVSQDTGRRIKLT